MSERIGIGIVGISIGAILFADMIVSATGFLVHGSPLALFGFFLYWAGASVFFGIGLVALRQEWEDRRV
jgi:hypothetical protein